MNASVNSSPDSCAGANISILLVEDESITREFLSQIIQLKFPSLKVFVAENGQAGLGLFRKFRIEVVLTDITMPVMDGIQMARQIRIFKPDVDIIALSAHSSLEDRGEGLGRLFSCFLSKPIVTRQLYEAIAGCVERNTLVRDEK